MKPGRAGQERIQPMMFGGVRRRLRRLRSERGGATAPILVLKTSTPPEIALALRAGAVLLLIGAVLSASA